jgi:transposase
VKYKSKTSLYLIFKDAKFTYHKPGQVYKNRDQNKVDQWKQHVLPVIQEYLKKKNTVVLTEDEMILSTQTTFQKIWLSANSYPKIEVSNNRKRRSIYGFLNLKTGKEHAFKAEAQTGEITVEMLEKVRRIYPNKKIIIVWDNAPWHRSKVVKEYLAKKGHNINLIPFPPYNPEDNPQEHVWKRGREMVTHNKFIEDIDTATDQFVDWLNSTTFEYSLSTI